MGVERVKDSGREKQSAKGSDSDSGRQGDVKREEHLAAEYNAVVYLSLVLSQKRIVVCLGSCFYGPFVGYLGETLQRFVPLLRIEARCAPTLGSPYL